MGNWHEVGGGGGGVSRDNYLGGYCLGLYVLIGVNTPKLKVLYLYIFIQLFLLLSWL